MTLKECQLAAYWRIPVMEDGVPYRRIVQVSINFRGPDKIRRAEDLEPWYGVTLESLSGNSITSTVPRDVIPKDPETFAQRVAQYNKMKRGESIGG